MILIKVQFDDERSLRDWDLAKKAYYKCLNISTLDSNTVAALVCYTDAELQKIQEYDNKRQGNDEKIILGTPKFPYKNHTNLTLTNPINLAKSGLITELEIALQKHPNCLLASHTFQLMANCVKHLKITILDSFTVELLDADYITLLINKYKDTLDQLELCFKTININALGKICKALEYWIINIPEIKNISRTTESGINDKPCESLSKYNKMQERLEFFIKCKRVSELFKEAIDDQQKAEICANIIKNDPRFNKNFSKYEASKVKNAIGDDNIYNILREYCTDNSTTDQQDEVINSAEVMNYIDLTTSGAIADCSNNLSNY